MPYNYVIYRHGSNSANQPMTPVAAVDLVEARNRDEAIKKSRANCYANQFLTAKPASKVSKSDFETAIISSESYTED